MYYNKVLDIVKIRFYLGGIYVKSQRKDFNSVRNNELWYGCNDECL